MRPIGREVMMIRSTSPETHAELLNRTRGIRDMDCVLLAVAATLLTLFVKVTTGTNDIDVALASVVAPMELAIVTTGTKLIVPVYSS